MTAPTRDRGRDAQEAAEAHLSALAPYSEWADEEDADPDAMPETAGPWCGCDTCQVREAVAAAWPHAIAYAADLVASIEGPADAGRCWAVLRAEIGRSTLPGREVPA